MIPIFEPYFFGNETKYINQCLKTKWISSQGSFVKKFEKKLCDFHKMKYCVATSSCTTSLHLALLSLGIGSGDEVLCPTLTFIAPANMIKMTGAKPVFVNINLETLTIDPKHIESKINQKTRAIIVVHQFGHASHMDEIMKIAKRHKIKVIEDCAESIGAKYKSKKLGTIGDISCFSFFSNKIITSGEGGALITNNKKIYERAATIRDHGMSKKKKYLFFTLGTNYRMTNLQAAIGLAQLENLNAILKIRKIQMKKYYSLLSKVDKLNLRSFADFTSPVHWLMTVQCVNYSRAKIISYMKNNGIDCRPMIDPVTEASHFKDYKKNKEFSNLKKVARSYIHLPSSTGLTNKEIDYICSKLKKFFKKY